VTRSPPPGIRGPWPSACVVNFPLRAPRPRDVAGPPKVHRRRQPMSRYFLPTRSSRLRSRARLMHAGRRPRGSRCIRPQLDEAAIHASCTSTRPRRPSSELVTRRPDTRTGTDDGVDVLVRLARRSSGRILREFEVAGAVPLTVFASYAMALERLSLAVRRVQGKRGHEIATTSAPLDPLTRPCPSDRAAPLRQIATRASRSSPRARAARLVHRPRQPEHAPPRRRAGG